MQTPTPTPDPIGDVVPRKDSHVRDQPLADGTMILFHVLSGTLMTLNPSAAVVWEYCDGHHSQSQIAAQLRGVFPDIATIAADVAAVLGALRSHGMLAPPA